MKRIYLTTAAIGLAAASANAGGIDRSGQSIDALFEEGTHLEFSFGSVNPNVSGIGTVFSGTPGADSGDMAPAYTLAGGAYKADINDEFSYAVIVDSPFGADVNYPAGGYFAMGSNADLNTTAVTGLISYSMGGFSVFGGPRVQSLGGDAAIPFVASYSLAAADDWGVGYVLGVAYEIPEIALRVALSANSEITHEIATTEGSSVFGAGRLSTTSVTTPKSINLSAQSGIAEGTLLFGSIRWVDWSSFDITPADYFVLSSGGSLVSYSNDVMTYSLGVGRRINENLALAVSAGYEASLGGFASNLGPTDGNSSIGVGATYTSGKVKVTGGVRYIWIGDAQTTLDDVNAASDFTGNNGFALGVKVAVNLD